MINQLLPANRGNAGSSLKPVWFAFCMLPILVGWLIPKFYEWSGSDQSRPSPWVVYALVGLVCMLLVFWSVMALLYFTGHSSPVSKVARPTQFRTIHYFTATFVVSSYLAIWMTRPSIAAALYILGIVIMLAVAARRIPAIRWQLCGLLSCTYMPFCWIAGQSLSSIEFLHILPALPAIVPTLLIGRIAGHHPEQLSWAGSLITLVVLLVGIGLIRSGQKRALCYCAFVFFVSTVSSFGFNAAMRM